jgi:hypothetical protein
VVVAFGLLITSIVFIRIIPTVFAGVQNDGSEKRNIIITVVLFSIGFLIKLAFCTTSKFFINDIMFLKYPLWL